MSWNHRVITGKQKSGDRYYLIAEVYYTEDGVPDMYTQDGKRVVSEGETDEEGIENLRWQLEKMMACLDKPMLDADKWPNEYVTTP